MLKIFQRVFVYCIYKTAKASFISSTIGMCKNALACAEKIQFFSTQQQTDLFTVNQSIFEFHDKALAQFQTINFIPS